MRRVLQHKGQSGLLEFSHKVTHIAPTRPPVPLISPVLYHRFSTTITAGPPSESHPPWCSHLSPIFPLQEKHLSLIVQKDNRDEATQASNVKELSGGERSFSTLALLLALGESIESPFRGMPIGLCPPN